MSSGYGGASGFQPRKITTAEMAQALAEANLSPELRQLLRAIEESDFDWVCALVRDRFGGTFPHVLVPIPSFAPLSHLGNLMQSLMQADLEAMSKCFDYRVCNLFTYALLTLRNRECLLQLLWIIVQHGGRALINAIPARLSPKIMLPSAKEENGVSRMNGSDHQKKGALFKPKIMLASAKDARVSHRDDSQREKFQIGINEAASQGKAFTGNSASNAQISSGVKGNKKLHQVEIPPLVALILTTQASNFCTTEWCAELFHTMVTCGLDMHQRSPKSVFQSPDAIVWASILRNPVVQFELIATGGVDVLQVYADLRLFCTKKFPGVFRKGHSDAQIRLHAMRLSMALLADFTPRDEAFHRDFDFLVAPDGFLAQQTDTSYFGPPTGMVFDKRANVVELKTKCRTVLLSQLSLNHKEMTLPAKVARLPIPSELQEFVSYENKTQHMMHLMCKRVMDEMMQKYNMERLTQTFVNVLGNSTQKAAALASTNGFDLQTAGLYEDVSSGDAEENAGGEGSKMASGSGKGKGSEMASDSGKGSEAVSGSGKGKGSKMASCFGKGSKMASASKEKGSEMASGGSGKGKGSGNRKCSGKENGSGIGKGFGSGKCSEMASGSGKGKGSEMTSGYGKGKGSEIASDSGKGKGSEMTSGSGKGKGSDKERGSGNGICCGKGNFSEKGKCSGKENGSEKEKVSGSGKCSEKGDSSKGIGSGNGKGSENGNTSTGAEVVLPGEAGVAGAAEVVLPGEAGAEEAGPESICLQPVGANGSQTIYTWEKDMGDRHLKVYSFF